MDGRAQGEGAGRGGRSLLIGQEALLGHAQPWVVAGTRGLWGGGARRRVEGGVSILSLRVCACGPFCGKWGVCAHSHERANARETRLSTSVCLGVWLWVCTQTYGTSKHRAPGVNFHGSVPGSVGRWVVGARA